MYRPGKAVWTFLVFIGATAACDDGSSTQGGNTSGASTSSGTGAGGRGGAGGSEGTGSATGSGGAGGVGGLGAGGSGGAGGVGGLGAGGSGGVGGIGAGGSGGVGGIGAGGSGGSGEILPSPPANLSVTMIDANGIHLTWSNPNSGSSFAKVRLLRALNAPPAGPDDAASELVYSGALEAAVDDLTRILPDTQTQPRTYFYTVYGCTQNDLCETVGSGTEASPTITECLRAGGYTFYFRHATATQCSDATNLGTAETTAVPGWWQSCDANCPAMGPVTATARQLSPAGVMEAMTIGLDMQSRSIPIGRVRTSEFCRCVKTAENMAFPVPIEQEKEITGFVYDEANRCANTMTMLADPPAPGTNTALVAHSVESCPPLDKIAWGEATIYKPDGAGGLIFISTVQWNQWTVIP